VFIEDVIMQILAHTCNLFFLLGMHKHQICEVLDQCTPEKNLINFI